MTDFLLLLLGIIAAILLIGAAIVLIIVFVMIVRGVVKAMSTIGKEGKHGSAVKDSFKESVREGSDSIERGER